MLFLTKVFNASCPASLPNLRGDPAHASVTPEVTKPVIAELGSVNPYIVVPGDAPWSQADIDNQADTVWAL